MRKKFYLQINSLLLFLTICTQYLNSISTNNITNLEVKEASKDIASKNINNISKTDNLIYTAIIGAGPAGLSAGLFLARAFGPQPNAPKAIIFRGPPSSLQEAMLVENWPGILPNSGTEILHNLENQVTDQNAIIVDDIIEQVNFKTYPFKLYGQNKEYNALSVVVTTGAKPNRLNLENEDKYWGHKGILSCGLCDPQLATNQDIVIIGTNDYVKDRIMQLVPYARSITVLINSESNIDLDQIKKNFSTTNFSNIKFLFNKKIIKFVGTEEHLSGVEIQDKKTNKLETLSTKWVFLAIGFKPNTDIFKNQLDLDENGYIKHNPWTQETDIRGIFAAGNAADPIYKLAATGEGDGTKAAYNAAQFLSELNIGKEEEKIIKNNLFIPEKITLAKIEEITSEEHFNKILEQDKPIIIEFYAPMCANCQAINKFLGSIAKDFIDHASFYKIDRIKNTDLSKKLDIETVPHFLIFHKKDLVHSFQPQTNKQEIIDNIKSALEIIEK